MKQAEDFKNWMKQNLHGDPIIWAVVIALSLLSILAVYSASGTLAYRYMESTEHYLMKHMALVILGMVGMYYAHKLDYRYYSKLSRFGLLLAIPLLLFAYFFGPNINDSKRWIVIPFINQQFQPSDLAKRGSYAGKTPGKNNRRQLAGNAHAYPNLDGNCHWFDYPFKRFNGSYVVDYMFVAHVFWSCTNEVSRHAGHRWRFGWFCCHAYWTKGKNSFGKD